MERLKQLIRESDYTQTEIAAALGISLYTLSAKLNHKNEFKVNEIMTMADLFNVSDADIMEILREDRESRK